ncbi:hypothetical protein [Pelagibaculum spongiae]|nr:hypothetical protein [Pelagibaculum spongiae]
MALMPVAFAKVNQERVAVKQLEGIEQQLILHSGLTVSEVRLVVQRAWAQFRSQARYARADRDLAARSDHFQQLIMQQIRFTQSQSKH